MKAAIISLGSVSSKMTANAMKKYFDEVDELDIRKFEICLGASNSLRYEGKSVKDYDCIYAKGSFKYAELLQGITTILSKRSYMPVRASAWTVCNDKLLTHLKLEQAKIRMPKTYVCSGPKSTKSLLKDLNYPIVIKFPKGTHGKGVIVADSLPSASSMLDALILLKQQFFIQEFIDTDGIDMRVFVVGDKVVGSYQRIAVRGEVRANIHAGGTGEAIEIDSETRKIAITAAKTIGAEICAIDILPSHKGAVVLEINSSPGLQGITKYTGIDIADKIAKHLFKKANTKTTSDKNSEAKAIFKTLNTIQEVKEGQKVIGNIKFVGNKMVLPPVVTQITKFEDDKEYIFEIKEGQLTITEFNLSNI